MNQYLVFLFIFLPVVHGFEKVKICIECGCSHIHRQGGGKGKQGQVPGDCAAAAD